MITCSAACDGQGRLLHSKSPMHAAGWRPPLSLLPLQDDYSNMFWPGVLEGVSAYFDRYGSVSRLAPFMLHGNKLYITTKTHHARYCGAHQGD